MKLTILHLSDLHFCEKHSQELAQIRDNLIKNEQDRDISIDCILFSGDLVQDPSIDKFEQAYNEFILPICRELKIDINNINFTPGNHDVNFQIRDEFLFEGVKKKIVEDQDQKSINKLRSNEITLAEHDGFVEFIASLPQDTIVESNRLYTIQILSICNIDIGFISLNSSLFTEGSANDRNNLWLSPDVLADAAKKIKTCSIKILNLHHSYNWYKNYKQVEKNILDTFNIVFFGHDHEHDGNYVMDMHNRDILNLFATSLFHPKNKDNGYCLYSYDINEQKLDIYKSVFNKKECLFDNMQKTEVIDLDLTKKAPNALRNEFICAALLPNIKNKINKYLTINLTSEKNDKDIEDIYIEQQLEEEKSGVDPDKKKDTVAKWKIQDLIQAKENILIRGKSESGKTSLLNMVNIKSLNGYTAKIPIYIGANKLKDEDSVRVFESHVGDYLEEYYGKNQFNCKKMIKDNRFVFLIDDIQYLRTSLITYILSFDCKIIATMTDNPKQIIEDALNNIVHNNSIFSDFTKLQIKPLKKADCHLLTNNIISSDNSQLAKTVYKTMVNLHLPSNPFIATLVTWMHIEKLEIKENEPAMIEVFLDYLLEKADLSIKFKGKFDFHQKIDLLSEIAFLFFDRESFAITENDIVKIIINYIDKYGHDVKPYDLLSYFYKRRIFINDNQTVMFSYRVFYYYFIAKYMERNSEFTENVMSNKLMIINMPNELNYYASIKRDDLRFIEKIINFMDVNSFQTELEEQIDFTNMVIPTEKNHFVDYECEIEDEKEHKHNELVLKNELQSKLSEEHEKKTEEYNYTQKDNKVENYDNNNKVELFLLNTVFSQFIKQLDKVNIEKKQELLNNAIKRYAQFMIYWEIKLQDEELMKRFLRINIPKEIQEEKEFQELMNDNKTYNIVIQNVIKNIMFLTSETAVDTLSTPKLTKIYDENLKVENNTYMYYFYTLIKSETNEINLIEVVKKFIKYNKDNNLFEVMRQKLIYDYFDKSYSLKTKATLKSAIIDILVLQTGKGLTGEGRMRHISNCHERVDKELEFMKLLT